MSSKWLFLVIYLAGLPILLLSPYFLFIFAVVMLIGIWIYSGGIASGNPYKRMALDGNPDWWQTRQYKDEAERGDETDYDFINFFGFVGFAWIITSLASFVFFP